MSDCSSNAWRVPEQREPGVLYDHGQPNYDYLQAHAIVVGGVRFERPKKCRIERRGMSYYCSECDEEVGSDDITSELYIDANAIELWGFCPRCGSVVTQ